MKYGVQCFLAWVYSYEVHSLWKKWLNARVPKHNFCFAHPSTDTLNRIDVSLTVDSFIDMYSVVSCLSVLPKSNIPYSSLPRSGELRTQKLLKRSLFKAWSRSAYSHNATLTARNVSLISTLPVH